MTLIRGYVMVSAIVGNSLIYADKMVVKAIIESGDRILLVRRSQSESRAGEWDLPGGKMEEGEGLEEALAREINEETSLDLIRILDRYSARQYRPGRMVFTYLVHTRGRLVLSDEHDHHVWVSPNQASLYLDRFMYSLVKNAYPSIA